MTARRRLELYQCFPTHYVYIAFTILLLIAIRHGAAISSGLFYGERGDNQIRLGYLLEHFKMLFESGILYPRWIGHLYGGYGYPTFLFYHPCQFFLMLPLTYFVQEIYQAVLLFRIEYTALTLLMIYLIARKFGSAPWLSLLLLVLILPKVENYGNTFGTQLFLLTAMYSAICATEVFSQRKIHWLAYIGFLFSCIMIITIHPAHAMACAIVLCFFFVGLLWHHSDAVCRKYIAAFFFSGGLSAIILTSPYWATIGSMNSLITFAATLKGYFTIEYGFQRHEARSYMLFLTPVTALLTASPDRTYYYYKLCSVLLICIGLFYTRRNKLMLSMGAAYLFLCFLLTHNSLFVWKTLPGLGYFQSPVRLFAIIDALECFIIAASIHSISKIFGNLRLRYRRLIFCAVFLIGVFLSFKFYSPLYYMEDRLPSTMKEAGLLEQPWLKRERVKFSKYNYNLRKQRLEQRSFQHWQGPINQFKPRTANAQDLKDRHRNHIPIAQITSKNSKKISFIITHGNTQPWTPIEAAIDIPTGTTPTRIRINQFYFPGWIVKVNGQSLVLNNKSQNPILSLNKNGLMRVDFSQPGHYTLKAYYAGPPHWLARNIIIAILSLSVLALYVYYTRRLLKSSTATHAS